MKLKWNKYPETKPPHDRPVLISDGKDVGLATYYPNDCANIFIGAGFGGYKWEWDFEPTYWAEIEINLPEKETK